MAEVAKELLPDQTAKWQNILGTIAAARASATEACIRESCVAACAAFSADIIERERAGVVAIQDLLEGVPEELEPRYGQPYDPTCA